MVDNRLLQLAKQGDPRAITAALNHSLQPRGISAKGMLREGVLNLALESAQLPSQDLLVPHLEKALRTLAPESIERVIVYGIQKGFSHPLWVQTFDLIGLSSTQASEAQPVVPDPSEAILQFLLDLPLPTLTTLARLFELSAPPDLQSGATALAHRVERCLQNLDPVQLEDQPEAQLLQIGLAMRIKDFSQISEMDLRTWLETIAFETH
ncbi:MAG: hypothetical protein HC921_10540 [Synechococcaceae cyanobacterium SM2_3_1]|nr:hypothetical protein [Synechococcaceae cyanobacterium SM2_3_1]